MDSPTVENYKFQRIILAVGGLLMLLKFLAYFLTGSVAILTDALESIVNVIAGAVGLYALYLSMKPRDFDHPYGHGKAENISATVEGTMIFFAGAVIIYQAIIKTINPPSGMPDLEIGLVLVAFAAVVNFILGSIAIKKGTKNRSQALVASGKHLHSDVISSVGIITALLVMYFLVILGVRDIFGMSIYSLDGLIALVFGGIIMYTGVKVVMGAIASIMDKADTELLTEVVEVLNESRHSDWIDIHNLKIVKYGTTLHMDMHVTFPRMMTIDDQYNEVCEMRIHVRDRFGDSVELSILGDPCKEFSCLRCNRECEFREREFVALSVWDIKTLSENRQHGGVSEEDE